MSLGTRIYDVAVGNAPLVAIIGQDIFPVSAPQGTDMPFVVWQKIASSPIGTHEEQNREADAFNRVQFTAFATTFEALETLCAALIAAFDGVEVITGHPANFEDDRDIPSELPGVFARALDFTF